MLLRPRSGYRLGCLQLGLRSLCQSTDRGVYDVVIVGAGMVGSCLASLLSEAPLTSSLRVAIVDKQRVAVGLELPSVPDARVSTITPASAGVLRAAGIWDSIAPPKSSEINTMQVWDHAGSGYIRWNAKDGGATHMGWVVENNLLQAALLERVHRQGPSTELMCPAQVSSLTLPPYSTHTRRPDGEKEQLAINALAQLQLADGRNLQARLVVAADGSGSRIRELAGLRTLGWDYNQRGLVATVSTSEPHTTAWQRFLPTGPLALLPVRDGLSNIVWSTTPKLAHSLEGMSPSAFAAAVNQALTEGPRPSLGQLAGLAVPWLGKPEVFEPPPLVNGWVGSPPKSFPLAMKHAGRYVRPRLALVGDAAHAVHPLAGQGVNLGIADVEALARALAYAVEHGVDLGDVAMLQAEYESPRRKANTAMMSALDSLRGVFALQAEPLGMLRNAGLQLLNSAGPVKNRIMQYAMGL